MKSQVSVVRCKNYEEDIIDSAVRRSVNLIGGLNSIIKRNDKVLLKVNLLAPTEPNKAVTTHPMVVKSIVKMVQEIGAVPIIADAPGVLFVAGSNKAMIKSGIKDVADEMGVKASQFESIENPFTEIDVPGGVWLKKIFAAKLALEADVVISVPKMKTHGLTFYTGAVKNMFGITAPKTRRIAHNLAHYDKFCSSVVDIYSVKIPQLAVMDAVVGMEGGGPRHGNPKYTGLILTSYDCVSLDAVASSIMGFDPEEIYTTKYADERGLGVGQLSNIEVLEQTIDDVRLDYEKPFVRKRIPSVLMSVFDRYLKIEPDVTKDKCNKCNICAKSCPTDGISMKPYPVINRKTCIECFCCNEMCPEGAMEIRKNWLARRLTG